MNPMSDKTVGIVLAIYALTACCTALWGLRKTRAKAFSPAMFFAIITVEAGLFLAGSWAFLAATN